MTEKDIVKQEIGTLTAEYWEEIYERTASNWEEGENILMGLVWCALDYIAWSEVDGVTVSHGDDELANCGEMAERYFEDKDMQSFVYSCLVANTTECFRAEYPEFWSALKEEANV